MSLVSLIVEALSQLRDVTITSPTNGQGLSYNSSTGKWVNGAITAAGAPVLRGPYTVNYTDLLTDSSMKVLWTPAVGDVLLRLFPNNNTVIQWDNGILGIGQDISYTAANGGVFLNAVATASTGGIGGEASYCLDSIAASVGDFANFGGSAGTFVTAQVFSTTNPVKIRIEKLLGVPPTSGHVDIYALVARAVAP